MRNCLKILNAGELLDNKYSYRLCLEEKDKSLSNGSSTYVGCYISCVRAQDIRGVGSDGIESVTGFIAQIERIFRG